MRQERYVTRCMPIFVDTLRILFSPRHTDRLFTLLRRRHALMPIIDMLAAAAATPLRFAAVTPPCRYFAVTATDTP